MVRDFLKAMAEQNPDVQAEVHLPEKQEASQEGVSLFLLRESVQNLETAGKELVEMLIAGPSESAGIGDLKGYGTVGPEGALKQSRNQRQGVCTASGDPSRVQAESVNRRTKDGVTFSVPCTLLSSTALSFMTAKKTEAPAARLGQGKQDGRQDTTDCSKGAPPRRSDRAGFSPVTSSVTLGK